MKSARKLSLLAFVTFWVAPCFAHHMALVVNKNNNVAEVTSATLAKIFRMEVRKWHDGKSIVLVLHTDSAGEQNTLERLSKMSSGEWKSFIAAHQDSIKLAENDADVLKIVESNPGAVGLIDVRSISDQVNLVKVDNKLPMEAGYLPH